MYRDERFIVRSKKLTFLILFSLGEQNGQLRSTRDLFYHFAWPIRTGLCSIFPAHGLYEITKRRILLSFQMHPCHSLKILHPLRGWYKKINSWVERTTFECMASISFHLQAFENYQKKDSLHLLFILPPTQACLRE